MKFNVFVHELLMKDVDWKILNLEEKDYLGPACLYGYKRFGIHFIEKSDIHGDAVVGDIFCVDEDKFAEIDCYYRTFGYFNINEFAYLIKDGTKVDCIIYVKEDYDMRKEELELLGSSEPFEWLRECFDMLDTEFKERFTDLSNITHFRTTNIDSFKQEVETYAKDHPDEEIYASGFVLSTGNQPRNEEYKYTKKKNELPKKSAKTQDTHC